MDCFRYFLISVVSTIVSASLHAAEPSTPYQRGAEAARLYNTKQWEQAAVAYAQVVNDNPDAGNRWNEYAHVLYNLKRHEESTAAYLRAIELGVSIQVSTYNIACNHALLGHHEEALAWLQKALDLGFREDETLRRDNDFDALRTDTRFRAITGLYPPEGLSREERWRFDLDFLLQRGERIHYDFYGRVTKETLRGAIENLKSRVGELQDHEVVVAVMHIMAMLGDGHSVVMGYDDDRSALSAFPIDLYLFSDGIFVRGAKEESRSIIGGRVLRVGNLPVDEALRAVRPYCAVDNEMGVKSWSAYLLRVPEVLHALRIIDDPKSATYVVETASDGPVTVRLEAEDPPDMHGAPFRADFVYAHQVSGAAPPLYLRNHDQRHWFESLSEQKLVYAAYNGVAPDGDETVAQFADRLFAFINEQGADYLVLDLRHNGGGNNMLNRPLVHGLIKCTRVNRKGHLFVITSRRTFSAAMNAAVDIERNTEAIFVGEPTGSSPNFVGEVSPVTLPCSGLRVSFSSLHWQNALPFDRRIWIPPAMPAPLSSRDFRDNRDPAMDAIFAQIAFQRLQTETTPASKPSGSQ